MEIVVVDDQSLSSSRSTTSLTVDSPYSTTYLLRERLWISTRARNIGFNQTLQGNIAVFCDQRQRMESDAVSEFVKNPTSHLAAWHKGREGLCARLFLHLP